MNGIITCIETGCEYGYSSLVQREYIIADLVSEGYTYTDRTIYVLYDD